MKAYFTPGVNWAYQVLRNSHGIKLESHDDTSSLGQVYGPRTIKFIEAVPGGPFPNDVMVTVDSAQGAGSFGKRRRLVDQIGIFRPCKNHASVADEEIAALVGPWIVAVERDHGDLRP